jgi:peptide/nickel transport system permease protein
MTDGSNLLPGAVTRGPVGLDAPPPTKYRKRRRQIDLVRKFRSEFLFAVGCVIIFLSIFLAVCGAWISPYDPTFSTGDVSVGPPSLKEWPSLLWEALTSDMEKPPHWFGTDSSGLDIFSRTISAPRTDMTIALSSGLLSLIIGTFLGLLAGFYKNWATEILMRVSDLLQAFPVFITAMILVALTGRNTFIIVIALGIVYTPIFVRLTRAEVLSQRTRGYVEAARAVGNSEWVVAVRHVLPNSLVPSLVQTSTTIGFAILLTSGLSFVGAGVRPPTPEWGLMIALGAPEMILGEWWQSVFPGLAISITVFGYAAVGHGLEEDYR